MYIWIAVGVLAGILILSGLLSIASFSSERFMQKYEELTKKPISGGLDIQDFLHNLNFSVFDNSLHIATIDKEAGDFYHSKSKTVAFSRKTQSSSSIASFAIVAHEMGHAKQDKDGKKLRILNRLRLLGGMISFLFLPLLLSSAILLFWAEQFLTISIILASCAGGIFLLAIIIKWITISIEKNASKIGLSFLKEILSAKELDECEELLNAARLSYWGDLFRLLFSWTLLTRKTKMFN